MKISISPENRAYLLKIGIPRQTINNWTSGRVKPSRSNLYLLTQLTGKNYIKLRPSKT